MHDRDEIDAGPPSWPVGWHVHRVEQTGSTNADLMELANGGAADRTVLMAGHQTAGRGRLDRRWDAPPGSNLLASLLLRDAAGAADGLHAMVQRVALAAADACAVVAGIVPELKWPNDLLVNGAKLAGILAEAGGVEPDRVVVVGVGLNVRWAPPGAARLGDDVEPADVLVALLEAFDRIGPHVAVLYRSRLATLGRRVRVELPGGRVLEGVAAYVEANGALVVHAGGAEHMIDAGDVVHLR